jgi:hypothetical protein
MAKAKHDRGTDDAGQFEVSWREVRLAIMKSCLLDRVLYQGERPSQTPCPVHKGIWSGCHIGWPGQTWSDGRPVDVSEQLQKWHDAGCRCHLHKCGCTTGWQPDVHCGCVSVEDKRLECDPAGACETHGRCWTHSEWQRCGSLIRSVSSDPCEGIADGVDGLCSACREFKTLCEQHDATMGNT